MNDDAQRAIARMTLVSGRLDALSSGLQRQAQDAQATLQAVREREEAEFRQTMAALFRQQQQRMESALWPKVVGAWKIVVALAIFFVLLLVGFLLLLKQANDRLQAAQARADAAEVRAEVQEASQHVEITSCGGRPCIRLDQDAPTWTSKGSEYVLVDGVPGEEARKRR